MAGLNLNCEVYYIKSMKYFSEFPSGLWAVVNLQISNHKQINLSPAALERAGIANALNSESQAPKYKRFDRLTALSHVEGQISNIKTTQVKVEAEVEKKA